MSNQNSHQKPYLLPLLLFVAVLMVLGMLRLAIWQLDRAAYKQSLLDQVQRRAAAQEQNLPELLQTVPPADWVQQLRFRPIVAEGQYLPEKSILIDNQVLNKQGGYQLITPMRVEGLEPLVMVSRGWLAAGATRQDLPEFETPDKKVVVSGRLNLPPAQPPLWKEGYPVNDGRVWQYLPLDQYAEQIAASVLPLVVELAPENAGSNGLKVHWQAVNDAWVAKHKAYAFQWFTMAAAFFVACLVLLFRRRKSST